ncbi:hypothetical protein BJ742DRAFT_538796 [Cladochytrium replicatum]|nr:hypothetical protein BJ742DRAFT_538796 [Cladochytrium replicatum]
MNTNNKSHPSTRSWLWTWCFHQRTAVCRPIPELKAPRCRRFFSVYGGINPFAPHSVPSSVKIATGVIDGQSFLSAPPKLIPPKHLDSVAFAQSSTQAEIFIAECGAFGNVASIHGTVLAAMKRNGCKGSLSPAVSRRWDYVTLVVAIVPPLCWGVFGAPGIGRL